MESGPAHGIVTKTVHKTLPRGGGGQGGWGTGRVGGGVQVWWGLNVGVTGGVSRCHSIDRLPKLWLLHIFSICQSLDSSLVSSYASFLTSNTSSSSLRCPSSPTFRFAPLTLLVDSRMLHLHFHPQMTVHHHLTANGKSASSCFLWLSSHHQSTKFPLRTFSVELLWWTNVSVRWGLCQIVPDLIWFCLNYPGTIILI